MSELSLPLLLNGQVEEILRIRSSEMHMLQPHLHRLRFPGGVRRFPLKYVLGLHTRLLNPMGDQPSAAAGKYSRSPDARTAIAAAETALDDAITSRFIDLQSADSERFIAIPDLEEVLCLGNPDYGYVSRWLETGAMVTQEVGGVRGIGETTLRSTVSWQRPLNYPYESMADVVKAIAEGQ